MSKKICCSKRPFCRPDLFKVSRLFFFFCCCGLLSHQPHHVFTVTHWGRRAANRNDEVGALQDFEMAHELEPTNLEALLACAPLKLKYQNSSVALAMCNAAVEACVGWWMSGVQHGMAELCMSKMPTNPARSVPRPLM